MKKVGRNDPCPCGSGKKFKKCCERKMIGKKFMASKIDSEKTAAMKNNSSAISSFFKHKVTQITPTKKTKDIKVSTQQPQEIKPEEKVDLVEEALKERLGEEFLKEEDKKEEKKPKDEEKKKD